jgi:hypothetical protein
VSITLLIFFLQAGLLLVAWAWHGGSDRLVYALAATFCLSVWAGTNLAGIDRQVTLSLADAALVFIAAHAWTRHYDLRGWWISWMGFGKIALRLGQSAEPFLDHWTFAAVLNATFIAQIIIAGGLADGLGRRIAHHLRSAGPRRARLLRNVEGR